MSIFHKPSFDHFDLSIHIYIFGLVDLNILKFRRFYLYKPFLGFYWFPKTFRIIGHGAFGEVFEGYLLDTEGPPVKVAIKSLPVESARDFGDDFEMEARLLSQFKHENIVTFFGVSFEQQPKYIVLEFLEGGDLKNFLRENRPKPVGLFPIFLQN